MKTLEEMRQSILEAFKQGVSIKSIDSSHRVKKSSIEAGMASQEDIERMYAKLCSLQEQSIEQTEQSIEQTENAKLRAENARLQQENARLREENARLQQENARLREENARLKAREKAEMEQTREQSKEQSEQTREQSKEQTEMQALAAKLAVIEERLQVVEQTREQSKEQTSEQSLCREQNRVLGFKLTDTTTTTGGKKYRKCYAIRGKAKVYLGSDSSQAESKIKAYCQAKGIELPG